LRVNRRNSLIEVPRNRAIRTGPCSGLTVACGHPEKRSRAHAGCKESSPGRRWEARCHHRTYLRSVDQRAALKFRDATGRALRKRLSRRSSFCRSRFDDNGSPPFAVAIPASGRTHAEACACDRRLAWPHETSRWRRSRRPDNYFSNCLVLVIREGQILRHCGTTRAMDVRPVSINVPPARAGPSRARMTSRELMHGNLRAPHPWSGREDGSGRPRRLAGTVLVGGAALTFLVPRIFVTAPWLHPWIQYLCRTDVR
jgi:hypothetical protein